MGCCLLSDGEVHARAVLASVAAGPRHVEMDAELRHSVPTDGMVFGASDAIVETLPSDEVGAQLFSLEGFALGDELGTFIFPSLASGWIVFAIVLGTP